MLGRMLECHFCDMPHLPEGAATYKQTREFDEHSVPKGLLASHRTRAGTWGRIVVLEGLLLYSIYEPRIDSWVLRPGIDGILEPTRSHWVRPQGPVRFRVEFLRVEPTR